MLWANSGLFFSAELGDAVGQHHLYTRRMKIFWTQPIDVHQKYAICKMLLGHWLVEVDENGIIESDLQRLAIEYQKYDGDFPQHMPLTHTHTH